MSEAVQSAAGVAKTLLLRALGLSRASFYRSFTGSGPEPAKDLNRAPALCRVPGRALSEPERQSVRDLLFGEEFVDQTPTQIFAALLDRGVYHCSARTMYRLLEKEGPCPERTRNRTHTHYAQPELLATRPNELWSWDITRLKGPAPCHWYQLYVILDVFSRYVVAWMVADRENQELAAEFIDRAIAAQNIQPGTLTIHADRGAAMTSKSVAVLLSDLGVTKTHSRPHVSNDNPYSEAQFKTLKYRPQFPARFGSIEDARAVCAELFRWYNEEHYHSGIALLTPAAVHYGKAQAIITQRQTALDAACLAHPERFVNRPPSHPVLPEAVWINPPQPSRVDDPTQSSP
jgi:Transposase and inactivated derivatives